MAITKTFAGAGAAALFALTAVVGVAAPAHAAPSLTVTPNANLKGQAVVTVTYSGFSPNAPVAVGVCPTSRVEAGIKGPGDCGRSKNGYSKLTTADASGKGTAEITIPEGALGNATPPAAECPPCSIGATNIANAAENAAVALNYGDGKKSGNGGGKNKGDKGGSLPVTGPRETAITALIGIGLLQLGLVLAIRAHRSSPRRTAA